jgi:imidazolonepropionase-like amidohydrolase
MRRILIENGQVIDGTGVPPVLASVLIEGDRIIAVGSNLPAEGEITRIDASGLAVMPGLIDAHCHITFDEPLSNDELFFHRREGLAALIAGYNVQKVLRAGVTGIFDADSIFSLGVDLRDAIEAGIVEGPRMTAGGNALLTSVGGAAGSLLPDQGSRGYARITPTRDEIIMETRRQIKAGVDWVKVHVTGLVPRQKAKGEIQVWNFDELRAVCDTAHDLGIPVVGHCRNASSTRDAARAGFDMILHATFMDEEALEAVVSAKVPLVPTLTFQANLADYGDKVGADPALREIFRREIDGSSVMLRRAYDAGVPLLSGTESGFALTPYGHWHWRELEVFVKYLGLTPLQAIACATSEGARALGLYGKTGRIAEGYLADIIIVDGDVAKNVSLLGEPERLRHIFLGGRPIDLSRPLPERKAVPGWRLSPFAVKQLTRDVAHGKN